MGKKNQKVKTKIIYKEKPPTINKAEVMKELSELEAKKETIKTDIAKEQEGKKGFAKFLGSIASLPRKAAINKAISNKRRVLGTAQRTEQIKGEIATIKQRTELEKARSELREVRQKNQVDFGNVFGQKKEISEKSIFG